MKDNRVEIKISGLKCDNKKCDYYNGDVKSEDYKNYIDVPCPKCGESLLTQFDYDMHLALTSMVQVVNNMSEEDLNKLGVSSGTKSDEKIMKVEIHNGVKFTEE